MPLGRSASVWWVFLEVTRLRRDSQRWRSVQWRVINSQFEEYLHIVDKMGWERLKQYCRKAHRVFCDTHLRRHVEHHWLMNMNERHHNHFGMSINIDCMYWLLKNYLSAWRDAFTNSQQIEGHTFNDHPWSSCWPTLMNLTCIFWCYRIEQWHQLSKPIIYHQ